jgi:YD repeat-containing protein
MLHTLLLAALVTPASAAETRTSYDPEGRTVRQMVLDGTTLVSETTYKYDGDNWIEKITDAGGTRTIYRQVFDGDTLTETSTEVAGQITERVQYTYDGSTLKQVVTVSGSGTRTTTYSYDYLGNTAEVRTVDGNGELVSLDVSEYATPKVPITVGASAGGSYSSAVYLTSLVAGFTMERDPGEEMYEVDPLELSAAVTYQRGTSQEVVTQDQLDASFGADLNHLLGRATFFLFTAIERNPVSNLNLDLVVAPLGVKYDFLPSSSWDLDASFAPIWNYRAVREIGVDCNGNALPGEEDEVSCVTNKLRGSVRIRLEGEVGPVTLSDTVEYQPNIFPEDRDFLGALNEDSIFRNTTGLKVALSDRLSLTEAFLYERDLTLAAQADCETATTLTFAYAF